MFVVPFVEQWPYKPVFTLDVISRILSDSVVWEVYGNSVGVALASAVTGTLLCYAAAMVNARSQLKGWCRTTMDSFAMLTNTVPGMVLGIGLSLCHERHDAGQHVCHSGARQPCALLHVSLSDGHFGSEQDERRVGNHGCPDGRQLAQDRHARRGAQFRRHALADVPVHVREFHGDHQCRRVPVGAPAPC